MAFTIAKADIKLIGVWFARFKDCEICAGETVAKIASIKERVKLLNNNPIQFITNMKISENIPIKIHGPKKDIGIAKPIITIQYQVPDVWNGPADEKGPRSGNWWVSKAYFATRAYCAWS